MRARRRQLLGLVVATACCLSACGDDEPAGTTAASSGATCADVEAPAPKDETFKHPAHVLGQGEKATAQVETSCGAFEIALDTKGSPKTANSFAFLAEQGFYDDTVFHRIAPGFVIQGGDPEGADPRLAGTGGPGYSITEAPPQATTYRRGLVAMAKTEAEPPGTSGSQFFVVIAPADAGLPPDYAVLGWVTMGLYVVAAFGELGYPKTEQPTRTVTIDRVTIATG